MCFTQMLSRSIVSKISHFLFLLINCIQNVVSRHSQGIQCQFLSSRACFSCVPIFFLTNYWIMSSSVPPLSNWKILQSDVTITQGGIGTKSDACRLIDPFTRERISTLTSPWRWHLSATDSKRVRKDMTGKNSSHIVNTTDSLNVHMAPFSKLMETNRQSGKQRCMY